MSEYGKYLYDNLPNVYKIRDGEVGYTLKRYLDALGVGFDIVEEETGKITSLYDIENLDAKFLPVYASMFGLDYDHNAPEDYQRKFLANKIEIFKRKGTKSVIEFTARELTGMEATVREGNRSVFRTWTPNNDRGSTFSNSIDPRTFGGNSIYYYMGGYNTDRFTVVVSLSNQNKDNEEIFLNTQLLAKLTEELVPHYMNVLFKAKGLSYKDSFTPRVTHRHLDRLFGEDTKNTSDIKQVDYTRMLEKQQHTINSTVTDRFIDRGVVPEDAIVSLVSPNIIIEEPLFRIKEVQRNFIEINAPLEAESSHILGYDEDITDVSFNTTSMQGTITIRDEVVEVETQPTYEDLGMPFIKMWDIDDVLTETDYTLFENMDIMSDMDITNTNTSSEFTDNIKTPLVEEVVETEVSYDLVSEKILIIDTDTNKVTTRDNLKDYIHTTDSNAIINLKGKVEDKYQDILNSKYLCLQNQYAFNHEGIPNNLKDTTEKLAQKPYVNPTNPFAKGGGTFGHWVTTYLEKGKGELDDNVGIEVRNITTWWYNESTGTWDVKDEGFERLIWRKESLVYNDSGISISNTYRLIGSTDYGGADVGYILRHSARTSGYSSFIYGHQSSVGVNYKYYVTKVECRLVKYDETGYDALDDAHILLNVSNSWRASEDGICEHDWTLDTLTSFGRYIKVTRDWRTATTTNLPELWEGTLPEWIK